jgi:hypothetical protein
MSSLEFVVSKNGNFYNIFYNDNTTGDFEVRQISADEAG